MARGAVSRAKITWVLSRAAVFVGQCSLVVKERETADAPCEALATAPLHRGNRDAAITARHPNDALIV
jgi:hypothetical protein